MNPELSRLLLLETVGRGGHRERVVATDAERAALAARLGLLGLDALDAELLVRPEPGGGYRIEGRMEARAVQSCVVTLDPVPEAVSEPIDWRVPPPGEEPDEDLDAEGPDPVEAPGGVLDLGEALAQGLSLALDPYPRIPGATTTDLGAEPPGPFAALAKLRPGG